MLFSHFIHIDYVLFLTYVKVFARFIVFFRYILAS